MTQHQISGSVLAVLALTAFIITPYQVFSSESGVYPRTISACLFVLGILVAVISKEQDKKSAVSLFDPLLLICLVLVLVTIVCIRTIGFYPAIALSLPFCLILFGERSAIKITLFSLAVTGIIFVVIDLILGSRLP